MAELLTLLLLFAICRLILTTADMLVIQLLMQWLQYMRLRNDFFCFCVVINSLIMYQCLFCFIVAFCEAFAVEYRSRQCCLSFSVFSSFYWKLVHTSLHVESPSWCLYIRYILCLLSVTYYVCCLLYHRVDWRLLPVIPFFVVLTHIALKLSLKRSTTVYSYISHHMTVETDSKSTSSQRGNLHHQRTVMFARWRQCAPSSNTCFLGPTAVHDPNIICIGSAVFTQLAAESLYFTMGRP